MIGFVILSHRAPSQLKRLLGSLNALYDSPPIAVHHDFYQAPLDDDSLPPNVRFVRPHHRTGWGKWSLVQATLSGIQALYGYADPDYFVLLSGADYPIAPADTVLADLKAQNSDAFIDAFSLERALARDIEAGQPNLAHHRSWPNVRLARNRYLRPQIRIPLIRKVPREGGRGFSVRLGRHSQPLPFKPIFSPFDESYRCFVGSQWFTGSRAAARAILAPSRKDQALQRWLSRRVVPDESYFQTVICNSPGLNRVGRTFRFVEWNGGGAHPKVLEIDDLDEMRSSGDHFARKFEEDSPILDRIDHYLGLAR